MGDTEVLLLRRPPVRPLPGCLGSSSTLGGRAVSSIVVIDIFVIHYNCLPRGWVFVIPFRRRRAPRRRGLD